MSSDSNQITIDTASQTFVISVDTTMLDSGEIKIEESFFFVPATDPISDLVDFPISDEDIESPPPTIISYALSDLVDPSLVGDCLPYASISQFDLSDEEETIPI